MPTATADKLVPGDVQDRLVKQFLDRVGPPPQEEVDLIASYMTDPEMAQIFARKLLEFAVALGVMLGASTSLPSVEAGVDYAIDSPRDALALIWATLRDGAERILDMQARLEALDKDLAS